MEKNTKKILIACIAFSFLGITLIAALDYVSAAGAVNVSEIDSKHIGENIIVCGIVKSKSISQSGTTFMTLAENGKKIPFVFFKNEMHEAENISRGSSICARGTIQMYNGSAEIIGRRVVSPPA